MLVLQLDEMAAKPETKSKQDIGTFSDPACGNGTRQAEKWSFPYQNHILAFVRLNPTSLSAQRCHKI